MTTTDGGGFSTEERAAVKEYAAELRRTKSRTGTDKAAAAAQDLADAIAAMPEPDRSLAQRIDELVTASGADLARKTWYGMPAWTRDGKVLLFFKAASKFKERYATLGFGDAARLDDGAMWAKEFAVLSIEDADAARILELIRRAAG